MKYNNNLAGKQTYFRYRGNGRQFSDTEEGLPQILFITSYPPRECGIATYSQDLIKALNNKFNHSFSLKICPLESATEKHSYPEEVVEVLNVDEPDDFIKVAKTINDTITIKMVVVQHEFGFFAKDEIGFLHFLKSINKPIIVVFHTVLPSPSENVRSMVQSIANVADAIVVMTNSSATILTNDYKVANKKVTVIPHGTHLVPHLDKQLLKSKNGLSGRKVLSTFGLLSSGKSIETTLSALPAIIEHHPDVLFLIIGITHPSVVKQEGEKYRMELHQQVEKLQLQNHVKFINNFLPLFNLLEYLQLTDIYLFTSNDPNQAVSGTFSYAISCGCPVISTPIPHAREVLQKNAGIIIHFGDFNQLAIEVIKLSNDDALRKDMGSNGLHKMASTAWENAAIAHAMLFQKVGTRQFFLHYTIPPINLNHVKKLTTHFGMIQFSKINQPDIESGYTLDDNARALVAMCQHFQLTNDEEDLAYITIYLHFIKHCQQSDGSFVNYLNEQKNYTDQNFQTNLEDANGRAIWALGFMTSISHLLPDELVFEVDVVMKKALVNLVEIHSTRAMAFIIKGLYYRNIISRSIHDIALIEELADRLVQMFRHENDGEWKWFESYLTYGNSILPEAMLCAWLATGNVIYKQIAKLSFDFLLSKIFIEDSIKPISNKTWLYKTEQNAPLAIGGEQPIDVAYTILALSKFEEVFKKQEYRQLMEIAFNWFLGNNHLHQIIYNPCTGGCYDGLEEQNVNLNQGAESTVSYLMARLTIEMSVNNKSVIEVSQKVFENSMYVEDVIY